MTYALVLMFTLIGAIETPVIAQNLSFAQCHMMRVALDQISVPATCVKQQGV